MLFRDGLKRLHHILQQDRQVDRREGGGLGMRLDLRNAQQGRECLENRIDILDRVIERLMEFTDREGLSPGALEALA